MHSRGIWLWRYRIAFSTVSFIVLVNLYLNPRRIPAFGCCRSSLNGFSEDAHDLLVQVLQADEVEDAGDLRQALGAPLSVYSQHLLQVAPLLLHLLNEHPRRELIHATHAHLHDACVGLARLRIPLRQLSFFQVLGHFKRFVDLILDLGLIANLKCFNLSHAPLDLLPTGSLCLTPLQGVLRRTYRGPASEQACHGSGPSTLEATIALLLVLVLLVLILNLSTTVQDALHGAAAALIVDRHR